MNVGVYFPSHSLQSGGGYTYEQELFESLLSSVHMSNHNFVIFSKNSIIKSIPENLLNNVRNEIIPKRNFPEYFILFLIRYFFPMSPVLRKIYVKISNLENRLKRNKIDIMLFCDPIHEPTDIPYITIVWDLQHRLQPWFPEVSTNGEWYNREGYYGPTLQRATYILTGTSVGQKEISLFYGIPKDRIKILPLPTPNFVINNTENNRWDYICTRYNLKTGYLLYPAQFWSHKNHANLLYALKKVRESNNIPISLILIGSDKGNFAHIKKLTHELKLTECIQFLGFIPREDLIALYQNAFALVFPTFFGPDNLPPLEAFALRCPVIASKVSGSEEQLGDAALLVDPKNHDEIADAIVSLYTNPALRRQLIEKGYARAHQWTGKDFIKEIFSILDEFENIRICWGENR